MTGETTRKAGTGGLRVCVSEFGGFDGPRKGLVRLCGACYGSSPGSGFGPLRSVGVSSEEGARCEGCGAENPSPEGKPYLLAHYGDDQGLGSVFLTPLEFPLEEYAECARRTVAFPDEISVLRWAVKQFAEFEVGAL